MKIRLDQNLSPRMANAIRAALPSKQGYEVSYVGDEHPPGTSDPDWLTKFAEEDGTAIVSGDFRILQNPVDLVAFAASGLIAFFPPPTFERIDRFGKVAFIVRWWPVIIEQIKLSNPGDAWRLPYEWEPNLTRMKPLKDPRVKGRAVEMKPAKILKLPRKKDSA